MRNNSTFSNMILNNIGDAGQIKRKVYQRRLPENPNLDYYYIIRDTSPRESVLIEYGFIDNPQDLIKLKNNITNYAEGVVKAIADYLGSPYSLPDSDGQIENIYTVQKGDTLWSIAKKYNISVDELKRINNLTSNTISIGQQLTTSPVEDNETYIVQKGDSLWSISRRFGISTNDLINYNNLDSLVLKIGQSLKIPSQNQNLYSVQKGDTLFSIARKFNTTVDNLVNINNLSNTVLSIGQSLIIK